jgi:hypothetical protein
VWEHLDIVEQLLERKTGANATHSRNRADPMHGAARDLHGLAFGKAQHIHRIAACRKNFENGAIGDGRPAVLEERMRREEKDLHEWGASDVRDVIIEAWSRLASIAPGAEMTSHPVVP